MRVVCCQLNIVWEDKPANYARVRSMLEGKKFPEGTLVILPEMAVTGFSMNVARVCEGEPSETEAFFASCAKNYGVHILGGLVSAGPHDRGRNEAVVFSPDGKLLARYAKIHPFTLGGESRHYAAGNQIVSFSWNGCTVTPFICYDLRFPEIFRMAVRNGAEIFIVIASWPIKRVQHWVTLLQARAIENLAYVIGVNRAGADPNFVYPGRSLIIDPHGAIVADAGASEGMIEAELDGAEVQRWRKEFPALKDIHAEFIGRTDGV